MHMIQCCVVSSFNICVVELYYRGWDQREMACYPDKDSPGTTWNVEGHVNDKG